MKMRPTQGVSIPRSGHEAVYHVARLYFGDAFVYCDAFYIHDDRPFCVCGSIPCVNPARTFSKNHDFGLHSSAGVPM